MIVFLMIIALSLFGTLWIITHVLIHTKIKNKLEKIDDVSLNKQDRQQLEKVPELKLVTQKDAEKKRKEFSSKKTIFIINSVFSLFVLSLYFYLGHPELIGNLQAVQNKQADFNQIKQMINKLEERLQQEPDNINAWSILYQSYMALKQYDKAIIAAENLNRIVPGNIEILLQYADAIAMNNNQSLAGKPRKLIERALQIDPENARSLWLAGMAANEQGEYQTALDHWEKLLSHLENDLKLKQQLIKVMEQLKTKIHSGSVTQKNEKKLIINVSLNPTLENEIDPKSILFVYAKALTGSPMPLAIVRKNTYDLPLQVTLDNSTALMSSNTLFDHPYVQLIARISKSGNGIPESGDLIGTIDSVSTDRQSSIELMITKKIE